jgi:hypothetical protein
MAPVAQSVGWGRVLVNLNGQCWREQTLALGHPGEAHAHAEALTPSKVSWMVASFGGAHATDGEAWIERKSHLCGASRLIQCAKQA